MRGSDPARAIQVTCRVTWFCADRYRCNMEVIVIHMGTHWGAGESIRSNREHPLANKGIPNKLPEMCGF